MTVYLDILFFVNAAVDSALLWVTSKILCSRVKPFRAVCAVAVSCIYGVAVCIPELTFVFNAVLNIIFAVLITLIAFGFGSIRRFLRSLITFFCVSAAYIGVLQACRYVIPGGEDVIYIHNGSAYFNFPVSYIMAATAVFCIAQILIDFALSRRKVSLSTRICHVTVGEREIKLICMVDTGNLIRDAITGLPVVVAEKSALKGLVDFSSDGGLCCDESNPMYTRFRLVPFHGAGDTGGVLQAFRPDRFEVDGKEYNVLVAVGGSGFCRGTYNAIMPVL